MKTASDKAREPKYLTLPFTSYLFLPIFRVGGSKFQAQR